jgi:putative alpha-1,2-mannosidase
MVFDKSLYDPANEPDIAYPYLFSYFKGEEWRTQKQIKRLLNTYFITKPNGIPGNDDAGTMSTWAIFSMMGFYPDCQGSPYYTLTTPTFDKITIRLDPRYYKQKELIIKTIRPDAKADYIKEIKLNGKKSNQYRISHDQLINAGEIDFVLSDKH